MALNNPILDATLNTISLEKIKGGTWSAHQQWMKETI